MTLRGIDETDIRILQALQENETAVLLGMERREAPIYRGPDHLVEQPHRILTAGSQP